MKLTTWLLAALMACITPLVHAADLLRVEGLQMPAWLERAAKREPLVPGVVLGNGDTVITGEGGRVLLRLADGSSIRLGENGRLAFADLGKQRGTTAKELVTASLDVLSGAFRFTTSALYKFRGERDVRVRIATITAGIRGTDVWGKAAADRDIVCLIEGQIAVTRGADSFTMDQPLSFFIAPRNAPPLPVAPVPKQQLEQWAQETNIAPGGGARKGGAWSVVAVTHTEQNLAVDANAMLRTNGYASAIRTVKTETGAIYTVRIGQLASQKEAQDLAAKLKASLGFIEAKATR